MNIHKDYLEGHVKRTVLFVFQKKKLANKFCDLFKACCPVVFLLHSVRHTCIFCAKAPFFFTVNCWSCWRLPIQLPIQLPITDLAD